MIAPYNVTGSYSRGVVFRFMTLVYSRSSDRMEIIDRVRTADPLQDKLPVNPKNDRLSGRM